MRKFKNIMLSDKKKEKEYLLHDSIYLEFWNKQNYFTFKKEFSIACSHRYRERNWLQNYLSLKTPKNLWTKLKDKRSRFVAIGLILYTVPPGRKGKQGWIEQAAIHFAGNHGKRADKLESPALSSVK